VSADGLRTASTPPEADAPPARGPLTIAFLGLFGSPNLGNEATLAAFLHNMRARLPEARFVCIAPRQSMIERDHGIKLWPIDPLPVGRYFWRLGPAGLRRLAVDLAERMTEPRRAAQAHTLLDRVDVLVLPGTGLIDDFGQRPLDMPTHLDRWTSAAARRGVPVVYLSVGVSTVKRPASRALFCRALQRAVHCSFRDAASAANAQALGYRGKATVCPDLAFSLPAAALPRPRAGGRRVVGVGVMGYFGWNLGPAHGECVYANYLDKLCQLVGALLAQGLDVHLLTGDTRADDQTVAAVIRRCGAAAAGVGALHAPAIVSFGDVLDAIAATDLVVASRFHNVLLALMLGRPAVSIGYSDKNDALMARFGLERFCHDIERFVVASVLDDLQRLLHAPDPVFGEVAAKLVEARDVLATQYDLICDNWGRAA